MLKYFAKELEDKKQYIFLGMVFVIASLILKFEYFIDEPFGCLMSVASFLTWHIIFEFTGILVSLAVFFVTYYTYNQNCNLRSIFLGSSFLAFSMIDFFHTMSYKGMPGFFMENTDANRATTLWIVASLFSGIGYVIASFIPADKKTNMKKSIFLFSAIFVSVGTFIVTTYFPGFLPVMYIEGEGLTTIKIVLEYIAMLLFLVAMAKFTAEYRETGDFLVVLLAGALLLRAFSGYAFTNYQSVYGIYNYIGHIYKFIASFIIFRVMFIYNVQKPYYELTEARNDLQNYANNLDKIVNQRTQELTKINQKLLDDLEYARDIQYAMLPTRLPADKGVVFEAQYYPAERVSGDFYNVFKLDSEHMGFYIADVSGHGVPAAMLTVFLKQSIEVMQEDEKEEGYRIISPAEVLSNLYESFNDTNFKDDVYIVIFYAIYNIKTKELTYASAGLNTRPFVLKADRRVKTIHIKGFPICKFIDYFSPKYENTTIKLNAGDRFLLYTDGLIEITNPDGEQFGEKRLLEVFSGTYQEKGVPASQSVLDCVFNFMGDNVLKDDITFLMMEVQ